LQTAAAVLAMFRIFIALGIRRSANENRGKLQMCYTKSE
jgi:hypothetical protein